MPSVKRSALIPFSAMQMYDLVNGVEDYPAFIPWCCASSSEQLSEYEKKASLSFARGAIKTSFTTKNTLFPNEKIEMELLDGPFRHLYGIWTFNDIESSGSRVELDLEFELSNRIFKLTLEKLFNQISDRLVTAFVKRAEQIYR